MAHSTQQQQYNFAGPISEVNILGKIILVPKLEINCHEEMRQIGAKNKSQASYSGF